MPGRIVPLITDQIYHVLNRGISLQPTFNSQRDYERAIEILRFYQNQRPPQRYSQFIRLTIDDREKILNILKEQKQYLVEIIAYCLMPNHFHFLLKQNEENGISKFISKWTNSYTRYFNVKNKRQGALFQGRFKAIRVETDEQLLHLSRYIHLNPYSAYVVKTIEQLENYPYSSLPEYLGKASSAFCTRDIVMNLLSRKEKYRAFIFDQADYQRKLQEVKYLTLEN